jgi:hypothetical protein
VAVRAATGDEVLRLGGAAVVARACAVALRRAVPADPRALRAALPTLEWLRALGAVREPVEVGTAVLGPPPGAGRLAPRAREEASRWRLAGLADRVAARLGGAGAAAWIGPDRVVWFAPPGAATVTPAWLQRTGGGLLREVRVVAHADGEEALLRTAQSGGRGRASAHLRAALAPVDVEAARRRFAGLVPGGIVLDPDGPVPAAVAALPGATVRAVLSDASAFARDLHVRRPRSRFGVTPLCSGGRLVLIFLLRPGRRCGSAAGGTRTSGR